MKRVLLTAFVALFAASAWAQGKPTPKFAAKVPASILTPDTVQTRIGELKFFDGLPDEETVKKVYDNLDFARGVESFLAGVPAASVYAISEGLDKVGVKRNQGIGITEQLGDARSLFLTLNQTTVYAWHAIDLADGPVVVGIPPGVLGFIDDAYYRFIANLGLLGQDGGKGGKYLFVHESYKGALPKDGYFIVRCKTYGHYIMYRAFVQNGDIAAAVRGVKANASVYPFSAAAKPPATVFVNLSGLQLNTIHANDFSFYEELNAVVQHEPVDWIDPALAGLFAGIGMQKGKPFAPDARMKAILIDSMAVGNATARAILYAPREKRTKLFPDRDWYTPFFGGSHEFRESSGELMPDARTLFHYYATGITPAMTAAKSGSGSAYVIASHDSKGRYLDGAKTYKVTLPAPIPVVQFWSFTVYDNQTRSMLETDQKAAGIDSTLPALKKNADGSVTVWFSPKAPQGQEGNWVQTRPGKGWNTIFRLYGPLQPWIDRTWKPGDFELMN